MSRHPEDFTNPANQPFEHSTTLTRVEPGVLPALLEYIKAAYNKKEDPCSNGLAPCIWCGYYPLEGCPQFKQVVGSAFNLSGVMVIPLCPVCEGGFKPPFYFKAIQLKFTKHIGRS